MLNQLGKMSQQQLFKCAQAKKRTGVCPPSCNGNCNPANAPGQSTHERFNDGKAYRFWPSRFHLPVWGRGIDVDRARVAAFCDEARKEGFTVTLTYPGVANESQHVNFRKQPRISPWAFRPLKEGMSGPRVRLVVRLLWRVADPQTRRPYLDPRIHPNGKFTGDVAKAVRAFQHDHHQKEDGEVGIHTIRALRGASRHQKVEAKAEKVDARAVHG